MDSPLQVSEETVLFPSRSQYGSDSPDSEKSICELLALRQPNLLIPLSANASRGDQILNARSFERQGFSMVMEEEELTDEKLLAAVHKLYDSREDFINAMNQSSQQDPIQTIIGLIEDAASK